MIKQLWQIVDRLETIATEGFFDERAKQIELVKIISTLKGIIKLNEDDLK